jgi:hypothetical protein
VNELIALLRRGTLLRYIAEGNLLEPESLRLPGRRRTLVTEGGW